MIVCTCDHCGQVTESWSTLNINFRGDTWQKEICGACQSEIKRDIDAFIKEITIDFNANENNE